MILENIRFYFILSSSSENFSTEFHSDFPFELPFDSDHAAFLSTLYVLSNFYFSIHFQINTHMVLWLCLRVCVWACAIPFIQLWK